MLLISLKMLLINFATESSRDACDYIIILCILILKTISQAYAIILINISFTVVYILIDDEGMVVEKKKILEKIRLRGTVIVNLRETTKIEVNSL